MPPPIVSSLRDRLRHVGLTGRVFLGTASIVAVVITAAFVITSASVRRAGEAAAHRGLEQSADLVAQFLAGRSRSLAGGARVFVQGPYFRTLVAAQRRDDILDQTFEASEQLGADWVFITDDRGVLLAKSDEPAASGVAMGSVPLVAGALRGLSTSGFGVAHDSLLFQTVAVPIQTPNGAPIGVLVATRLVDSVLVRDVKTTTSSELLFYVRTAAGRQAVSLSTIGRAAQGAPVLAQLLHTPEALPPDITIDGVQYLAQGSTLTTAGGEVVGGFVVLRSRDDALAGMAMLRRSLAIAGIIGLLLSWLAAYVAARSIARPVRALASMARRAADGRYVGALDDTVITTDSGRELHELGSAFLSLMADLRDKQVLTGLTPPPTVVQAIEAPPTSGIRSSRQLVGAVATRGLISARPGFALEPGSVLANRYLIEALVGSGGLGVVYRARDRVLGDMVALKVLRAEVIASDDSARVRLADELRVARHLSHRNVVRVHDIGEADGITFLTMEYVDGASLQSIIESRGALPPSAVLSIARQLMRALAVIHAEGVVHGDLKPANLMLDPSGVLKVSDFGLARLTRRNLPDAASTPARRASVGHLAGAVVGTPEYMAPEQLIGAAPTVASDIYSAGVVLHECLRGTTPFEAETRLTFLAHKLDPAPPLPSARPQPMPTGSALESIIARMMTPSVDTRPSSASAMFEALASVD